MSALDRLPLFATDADLARAICGEGKGAFARWTKFVKLYENHGLPAKDPLLGGRYVPAVARFFEDATKGVKRHV